MRLRLSEAGTEVAMLRSRNMYMLGLITRGEEKDMVRSLSKGLWDRRR